MGVLLSFLLATGAAVRARATRNLTYGQALGAALDVYAPVGADGEAPVILFAHCGRRTGGDRRRVGYIGAGLASRGFVALVADYSQDAASGGAVRELAGAAAWASANAARFGGDPGRLFLMGHGDSARDIARLCLDLREPGDVRGAIGISGAYDELDSDHPGDGAPPMLLIAGQNDRIDPETTSRLARALRTAGGQVAEIRYPKLCDQGRLQRLTGPIRFRNLVLGEVERFVRLHSLGAGG